MKFARNVFLYAGIYGVLVIFPMYFTEGQIARDFPPAITHPEHFYGFIGVALAWQIAFLIMSQDPARYRPLIPACVLEKFGFGIAAIVLYVQGRLSALILGFGILDLVLGCLFIAAYVKLRAKESADAAD